MQEIYLVVEREFNVSTPLRAYLKKEDALKECERLAKGKYDEKIGISEALAKNYEAGRHVDFDKNDGFALYSIIGGKRNKPEIYFCATKINLQ